MCVCVCVRDGTIKTRNLRLLGGLFINCFSPYPSLFLAYC